MLLEAAEVNLYDFAHNFGDCLDRVLRNIQRKKACKFKDVIEELKMEFFEPREDYEQKDPQLWKEDRTKRE